MHHLLDYLHQNPGLRQQITTYFQLDKGSTSAMIGRFWAAFFANLAAGTLGVLFLASKLQSKKT